ncbi:Zinc finger, C2HC5-type [Kalmanozyma brasiliensis GHG001]|uniref:TRIP4/RQT4 C2HC5-type zinc finger domain-containing protein n=1 Tax=Kalmanozyma brasiliensis (strain GHG001) TaxID=1365824 RepID=V5EPG3_KALBG|nr:Zinc finger, C2HC5-type [Kalmanozyma brasiliensis GHG001]EST04828.1 Zinc finger, C2HC5-type [Kalmanozyma brasiliensis GHG001]
MAKSSPVWTEQLVSLLGLDKETVKTQIIPFLDSFDDESSLRTHLQGLVGTDTPLAKSFVRDFVRSRFRQQASASGSTTPTLSASATPRSASPALGSRTQKKRGKKTLAERAGIGQTMAPRKVEGTGEDEQGQMARLSEAFGGMGTVYRKKQGEDEFFAGTGRGKKGKQPVKDAMPIESDPKIQPVATAGEAVHDSEAAAAALMDLDDHPSSASGSHAKSQPSPPPTAEMLAIDAVVEELTSTLSSSSEASSSTTINRKMCFCQGRRHALAPYAPLCYSCGLILCSAIHPSPLSPLSSCPSCSASPLLGAAARSDLVAKLTAEREILFEQQLLQIQIQREQKKLNKTSARTAREEEAALFPKLGMEAVPPTSSNGVPHAGPVIGKHGALQKAKAIASDAQRTAKVLSLDMKTHKVKQHTKLVRPKAVEMVSGEAEKEEQEKPEDRDPFVGLDGSALVKNVNDDGLRSVVKTNARSKGVKGIPARSWTFAGQQVILRPTQAVS